MAEMLKRQYELLALKARLDTYSPREGVRARFALEHGYHDGKQTLAEWTFPVSALGLPERLDRELTRTRGEAFVLPPPLVEDLRGHVAGGPASPPLWLHLVKPYGHLALVPWERLLGAVLGVPILRLPDFIVPPPRETSRRFDVVLCGSMPASKASFDLPSLLPAIVRRILDSQTRSTRAHVFVDAELYGAVRGHMPIAGLNANGVPFEVKLHEPPDPQRFESPERSSRIVDPGTRIENPWLLWMRDALAGASVDVAHFVCHGYLSDDRGALALSESPAENRDRRMARFVGAGELGTFLTQVGAWAVAFSSPHEDYSPLGSRLLADTVGQARPVSVLYHELPFDRDLAVLGEAYRFLFAREPQPPPASGAVFMYCQPYRVPGAAPRGLPPDELEASNAARDTLGAVYEQEENVPAWLAASQRYIEQSKLEFGKAASSAMRPSEANSRSLGATADTLRQIQDIVAEVALAQRSGGRGAGGGE